LGRWTSGAAAAPAHGRTIGTAAPEGNAITLKHRPAPLRGATVIRRLATDPP
jgi:hypothetical protein